MNWISVKDKLPEKRVLVLVRDTSFAKTDAHDDKYELSIKRPFGVRFGYVCDIGFRVEGTNGECKITHWMPIPQFYDRSDILKKISKHEYPKWCKYVFFDKCQIDLENFPDITSGYLAPITGWDYVFTIEEINAEKQK